MSFCLTEQPQCDMLRKVILSVVIRSAIMLSVVILNVVAPLE
jgi:hypothetical protein